MSDTELESIPDLPEDSIHEPASDNPSPSAGLRKFRQHADSTGDELKEKLKHLRCKVVMGDDSVHEITVKLPDEQVDAILALLASDREALKVRLLSKLQKFTAEHDQSMRDEAIAVVEECFAQPTKQERSE